MILIDNWRHIPMIVEDNFLSEEDDCPLNDYDKEQHCYCGWGKKLSVIHSWHSSNKEDRRFHLTCTGIQGNIGGFS